MFLYLSIHTIRPFTSQSLYLIMPSCFLRGVGDTLLVTSDSYLPRPGSSQHEPPNPCGSSGRPDRGSDGLKTERGGQFHQLVHYTTPDKNSSNRNRKEGTSRESGKDDTHGYSSHGIEIWRSGLEACAEVRS